MTPPLLEELLTTLSSVKKRPGVLNYNLICFCPLWVYIVLVNAAKDGEHPEHIVYNREYSYSPLRIAGVPVIFAEHMTTPNFKFAQMISMCANGRCGV